MTDNLLDREDLMDMDFGGVDAKENVPLVAGKYLMSAHKAELKEDEDKDGNPRLVLIFTNKVVRAIALDKDVDNPAQYEGQMISERFYSPTTDNIGYVRKYIDNVMGAEVKPGSSLRELTNALTGDKVRFTVRVTTRKYQDRDVANMSRTAKHFVGFEKLPDEMVEG